ncbi:MAG: flagellar assembly protein FliX [Acidobacteriia bacterium]|nr:hypothetical protein [Methyloceanibacter sp.]MCL6492707.1 flagellar assembly protein FliX [Terriglobia bacterium]
MIEVSGVVGVGQVGPTSSRRSRAAGAFSVPSQAEAKKIAPAAPSLVDAVDGLLALQEEEQEFTADQNAMRYGQKMLAALLALQRALLAEPEAEAAALEKIKNLLATMPIPADPVLADLITQISLRAHVELAKRRCDAA